MQHQVEKIVNIRMPIGEAVDLFNEMKDIAMKRLTHDEKEACPILVDLYETLDDALAD
jgi:hypothetical protein